MSGGHASARRGAARLAALLAALAPACGGPPRSTALAVPDKLVVLTFDDSVRSHYTVARPLLEEYGFGATFFVTTAFSFREDKESYMTWDEIRELSEEGFEIGNHTANHIPIADTGAEALPEELRGIDEPCAAHGIPRPVSFAWPGNLISEEGLAALERTDVRFGRRGARPEFPPESDRGPLYDPAVDSPLLIPAAALPGPGTTLEDLIDAVEGARDGKIAVIQFHGVPEGEHPLVSTPRPVFEAFLRYLHENGYECIAVRDLEPYVDRDALPGDPLAVIRERMAKHMGN